MNSGSRIFTIVVCALGMLSAPGITSAIATRVDDSGTIVRSPTVQMRWQEVSRRQPRSTAMNGVTVVQVRLNVTPWLKRSGKIFLVLPTQLPGPIRAEWTTRGQLLPGQVVSGQRALVYSGPINTPLIEDVLELTLTVDGRQLQQNYRLDFLFEMETP